MSPASLEALTNSWHEVIANLRGDRVENLEAVRNVDRHIDVAVVSDAVEELTYGVENWIKVVIVHHPAQRAIPSWLVPVPSR